ncbi:Na+/H+ antiporter NhaA [Protaetiibacter intestinalis]|uniref:Na(+)/H(+) antiporter NhaA n=1 Tax=Protaetiibacter intestinalis TaxID=2419774 RepID=A0A387BE65_9MICO|nr:Na+/H+ antiporter NhaA [Protaetiibacter intestinalis]AYF99405.1 Na+/H+ antiporter NhaA [Protaetiibacter intestinalis]
MSAEKLSALLMLLGVVLAMAWANGPWPESYRGFWSLPINISIGQLAAETNPLHVVNEVLMTLFFFIVGLEVKREFAIGELRDWSRALVPVAAAVGGLLVPALIFIAVASGGGEATAWGIVISTDTAFLLGALSLISLRFPQRLRTFLLTLAVADDIGALIVIAFFYTGAINLVALSVTLALLAAIAMVRYLPSHRGFAYAAVGAVLWLAAADAGLHPTLTGVAVALFIPVFSPSRPDVERTAELSRAFRESPNTAYAAAVARSLRESLSINERVQSTWRPYVAFGVLPLFALANAGVTIDPAVLLSALVSPIFWGVIVALVAGKFAGISGVTWILRKSGKGTLAPGLSFHRIAGGAALSGIGFTISLFLVPIALEDPTQQDIARIGILVASLLAFAIGWAVLGIGDRLRPPRPVGAHLQRPVDSQRDHIRGPVDAPMTIVEYGDFECPYCGRATGVIDEVFAELGDELRWVWRHLPLDQLHPHAQIAAQASEAAAAQGKFYEMARLMFRHQQALSREDLFRYAEELEMDAQQFEEDYRSADTIRRIQDDRDDAASMDLHSTPTFFIGSNRHLGPWDAAVLVEALRASIQNPPHSNLAEG